ncbi:MAG: hypothetical protein QF893_01695 [Alphaproteobacteria bacterium]|nr:hypothetical protein [Alphaproteobacteria bacterium]
MRKSAAKSIQTFLKSTKQRQADQDARRDPESEIVQALEKHPMTMGELRSRTDLSMREMLEALEVLRQHGMVEDGPSGPDQATIQLTDEARQAF